MRIVRIVLIGAFILSLGLFGATEIIQLANRDASVPVITSDREVLEIPCDYTQDQLLEGLTATDATDGDLTDQIIPGTFSRFISDGICEITYVVFDSDNQPGTLTRRVSFTDYHPPRFTLSEPLVFVVQEGSYSAAMSRIGAWDMLDGDLTDWVTQTDTNLNYSTAGTYTMTVQVSNSFGDTSSVGLPVHVVSAESALEIRLTSPIVYLTEGETIDPDAYVEAVTDSDGNSLGTEAVESSSGVDTETPGCYEIHYTVSDSSGNTGETWLTVIVEETRGGDGDES